MRWESQLNKYKISNGPMNSSQVVPPPLINKGGKISIRSLAVLVESSVTWKSKLIQNLGQRFIQVFTRDLLLTAHFIWKCVPVVDDFWKF